MENNKLIEEIECILMVTVKLFTLTRDVAIKFAEWRERDELKLRGSYQELFDYFINNVYSKQNN